MTQMNDFMVKPVKTQETLGEYLVSLRTRLGLSLKEVALVSRIQSKYLTALEQGHLEELPDRVYVRGFLRSLAQVYRVRPGRLVSQFESESEIARHLSSQEKALAKGKFLPPYFILSPKTITILGVSVLAIFGLSYLYFQVRSLTSPPVLKIFTPQDGVVNSSWLQVRGQSEPSAQVFLNNQPVVVDADGNFQENLSLGRGANQLVIRAVNKFGQETTLRREVNFVDKEIAGSALSGASSQAEEIGLQVLIGPSPTWIYLVADGLASYSGTMAAGSSKNFKASEKILLTTGNAGSTQVILDGKDLGVLGKEGEVLRDIEFLR